MMPLLEGVAHRTIDHILACARMGLIVFVCSVRVEV